MNSCSSLVGMTAIFAVLACIGSSSLRADEIKADLHGLQHLETAILDTRPSLLLPSPSSAGLKDWQNTGIIVLNGKVNVGVLSLSGQFRALGRDTGLNRGAHAKGGKAEVDELFLEFAISKASFLYAGRRNIAFGQSYGINPADVFFDESKRDRRLPVSRQRSETRGMDLIGGKILFDSGVALEAFYAPSTGDFLNKGMNNRWLLSYRSMIDWHATDVTFLAFGGDRPGGGLSFSGRLIDDVIFYGDMVLRRGRSKATVEALAPDGSFILSHDRTGLFFEGTLGFGYVFGNGLSINAEYSYLTGGYSDREWSAVLSAISANMPVMSAEAATRVMQLSNLTSNAFLRRNYVLLRLSHEALFGTSLQGEVVLLHGMDDSSGFLTLRLDCPVADNLTLSVVGSHGYGARDSEFGFRSEQGSLALQLVVKF